MAETVSNRFETTGSRTSVSFNISEFKSRIGNLVRPNIFSVRMVKVPKILTAMSYSTSNLSDMEFRCERAEIPGKSIATVDETGPGPTLKLPYDTTYNDMQLTFICSEDMFERRFFESWMDEIVALPGSHGYGGMIRYYDDFALDSTLQISQAGSDGKSVLWYNLYHAFPIQMSPMTLAWEESNTYQRFTVTMSYRYHVMIEPGPTY